MKDRIVIAESWDGLPVSLCLAGHRLLRGTSQHLRTSSLYGVSCLAWRPKPCALEHGKVPHDSLDPRQDPRRPSRRKASQVVVSAHGGPSRAAMGFVPLSLQTAGTTTPLPWYAYTVASRHREHQGLGNAFSTPRAINRERNKLAFLVLQGFSL